MSETEANDNEDQEIASSDQSFVRNVPYSDCIWTDVHGDKRFAFEVDGAITIGQVGAICDFEGVEITFRQFEWQSHGSLSMCFRTLFPGITVDQVAEAIAYIEQRVQKFRVNASLLLAKHQEGA